MTTNNTTDVARAFLGWLDVHAEEHPNPEDFLEHQPTIDTVPITEAELLKAALRLEHLEMIKGGHAMGTEMPFRVRLLPAGRECLDSCRGDTQLYQQRQRGGAAMNNFGDISVTTGNNSNVGVGSHFSQSVTINDPDALRRVGTAAQELANLLEGKADVAELRAIGAEVERTAKDPAKVEEAASAANRLKLKLDYLVATSSASTIVYYLVQAVGAALG